MLRNIGLTELLVLLAILLLVFGSRRIPEISESLAKAVRKFRDGMASKDDNKPG